MQEPVRQKSNTLNYISVSKSGCSQFLSTFIYSFVYLFTLKQGYLHTSSDSPSSKGPFCPEVFRGFFCSKCPLTVLYSLSPVITVHLTSVEPCVCVCVQEWRIQANLYTTAVVP